MAMLLGITWRKPTFDRPGDRKVLAEIIRTIRDALSNNCDITIALVRYSQHHVTTEKQRRVLEDLRQVIYGRLSPHMNYRTWLQSRGFYAWEKPTEFVEAQKRWLDAIAEEFKP